MPVDRPGEFQAELDPDAEIGPKSRHGRALFRSRPVSLSLVLQDPSGLNDCFGFGPGGPSSGAQMFGVPFPVYLRVVRALFFAGLGAPAIKLPSRTIARVPCSLNRSTRIRW